MRGATGPEEQVAGCAFSVQVILSKHVSDDVSHDAKHPKGPGENHQPVKVYRREARRPEKAQYSGASWTVISITSVAGTVVDGVAVERGGATVAKTALQQMLLCHIDAAAMSPCVNARHDPVGFRVRYSNCAATPTSYVLPNPEHVRENRAIRSMPLHVIVHNPPGMNNQVPVRFFEWGWV